MVKGVVSEVQVCAPAEGVSAMVSKRSVKRLENLLYTKYKHGESIKPLMFFALTSSFAR
jgi:hypothetical protein